MKINYKNLGIWFAGVLVVAGVITLVGKGFGLSNDAISFGCFVGGFVWGFNCPQIIEPN